MDYAFGAAVLVAAGLAAGHAVVYKRDPRSAALWLLAILLLPAVGPVLYALLGVNRVQRRALRLRRDRQRQRAALESNEKPQGTELTALARGIEAGPDQSFERLRWAILGGLNAARRSVRICTPYFVPDAGLISELNAAALRGVEVDVLLPQETDLPHVQWAATHQLWQVLEHEHGCRVWQRPGPFDHSKLMLVDAEWSLFGSVNWDARSLRLNFEFNVEAYCRDLGGRLERLFLARRAEARPVTLADVNGRTLPVKLRDGVARLFAPYL